MSVASPESGRIASLDQFRGYTVLGMFFVNFIGHFAVIAALAPVVKHHNSYCSYADTIMPQFFLAVGFAYRLTFLKRWQTAGLPAACRKVVQRNLGLILLGAVIYHLDGKYTSWAQLTELGVGGFLTTAFQRNVFQTLVHIGVTSLWVLPVIGARPAVRVAFAAGSGLLHLVLSDDFYYAWVMHRPGIDGGPLGFLTWTIPLLAGSLACDAVMAARDRAPIGRLLVGGAVLMLVGYGLSCLNLVTPPNQPQGGGLTAYLVEPPFVPPSRPVNLWTMSQRAGSLSYLTFGAGFSLALYALFVWACDVGRFRLGLFTTLGGNALAAYLIHELVSEAVKPLAPQDAPLWFALAAFGVFFGICYLFLRYLEKQRLYLRL
jgi:predicted acyltransferase